MMNIRNCKTCGKIFNYIGGMMICPTCKDKLEEKFKVVKKYIYEHPSAQIYEVAEDTEVSVNQIKQWVREERLTFSKDSNIGLDCEGCGTLIKFGRFCNSCKEAMVNQLNEGYATKEKESNVPKNGKKSTSSKMHYLNRDRF